MLTLDELERAAWLRGDGAALALMEAHEDEAADQADRAIEEARTEAHEEGKREGIDGALMALEMVEGELADYAMTLETSEEAPAEEQRDAQAWAAICRQRFGQARAPVRKSASPGRRRTSRACP
jgi:hypothetical protein